jgi:hypothetical protein
LRFGFRFLCNQTGAFHADAQFKTFFRSLQNMSRHFPHWVVWKEFRNTCEDSAEGLKEDQKRISLDWHGSMSRKMKSLKTMCSPRGRRRWIRIYSHQSRRTFLRIAESPFAL